MIAYACLYFNDRLAKPLTKPVNKIIICAVCAYVDSLACSSINRNFSIVTYHYVGKNSFHEYPTGLIWFAHGIYGYKYHNGIQFTKQLWKHAHGSRFYSVDL